MKIKWYEPKFSEMTSIKVREVIRSGYVSEGPITKLIELLLAKELKVKHVIMTTSCTAALYLALEADKKIKKYIRGYVFMPDLTFVGTKSAIEMAGLKKLCVDVEPLRFCMDPKKEIICEEVPKALIAVNMIGKAIDKKIVKFCDKNGITLICDNAGALGSKVPIGKVGCYSLQGNKIISCGQGGFCATNDSEYATKIRQLKDHGRVSKEDNSTVGFNLKFNDILAAVVLEQLEELKERKLELRIQRDKYCIGVGKLLTFPPLKDKEVPLWVEVLVEGSRHDRNKLVEFLEKKKIGCRIPWKPVTGLKNATDYYQHAIWLPNGPNVSLPDIDYVIKIIKEYYNGLN